MKRWLTALAAYLSYGSFILLLVALIMGWMFYHFAPWPPS
jgi:hypothetical protein